MTGSDVLGAVLCGGQSRRMGGTDKALIDLGGQPLLKRVSERLQQQVPDVVLSVNAPSELHRSLSLPLLSDVLSGHLGPLAGVHTALKWAQDNHEAARWVMTAAVDTPFFPEDMVATLREHADATPNTPFICESAGRQHFAFGLWPVALCDALEAYLASGGRAVRGFFDLYPPVFVEFSRDDQLDPFFNINSPEDLPGAEVFLL